MRRREVLSVGLAAGGALALGLTRSGIGDVVCAGLSRRFPVGDRCRCGCGESPTCLGTRHAGARTESCVHVVGVVAKYGKFLCSVQIGNVASFVS